MSVVLIFSRKCGSYGYQARAHVAAGMPRLTRFLSFNEHGGRRAAKRKALWHETRLKAQARRMRGEA